MHIKTLRHKGNTIYRLLNYLYDGMTDPEQDFSYTHNLLTQSIPDITAEFLANDTYRSNHAKVRWYHEVLSFSPKDKEHVTDTILADIANEYIQQRNPNALCVAVAHKEKEHIHLHFCFSGTEFRSKNTLRIFPLIQKDTTISIEKGTT